MFINTWNYILNWFRDRSERAKLIRSFNDSSKEAFIKGIAPILMEARISRGDSGYKHQFSHWLNSGFRIKAFQGRILSKNEIQDIGAVILSDDTLVRRLVVLGFDTLEIQGDQGEYGCKWRIKAYLELTAH